MSANTPVSFVQLPANATPTQVIAHVNASLALIQRAFTPVVGTFPPSMTTPSIAGAKVWKTNNSGATSITGFTNGAPDDQIVIIARDSNTTVVNSATLRTKTGANVALTLNHAYHFVTPDGREFIQVE